MVIHVSTPSQAIFLLHDRHDRKPSHPIPCDTSARTNGKSELIGDLTRQWMAFVTYGVNEIKEIAENNLFVLASM
jgi:hypothetical protein